VKTYSPLKPLSDDDLRLLAHIADIYASFPMVPCNTCQYCMPCPYGLDIPGIFSHYNKCINEGLIIEDRQDPEYAKARKAFLIGYDRSVPRLRQANHCIGCNHCLPECPQRINIPRKMQHIDRFVEELKRDGAELGTTVILSALSRTLDEGRYSCVIYNNGETRTFKQRGVLDLHDLVSEKSESLRGALMSDKIVGKGAAALKVLGGVKAIRTEVISTPALKMLTDNGIKAVFDTEVPYVENRRKTGQCPLDNRLQNVSTPNESWPVIQQFVADLRAGVDVMQ
jgi:Fe-S-cluster-containing dehydrogenase component